MDATPSGSGGIDEEWLLILLAGMLSSVTEGVATIHRYVERSLGRPTEPSSERVVPDAAIGLIVGVTGIAATTVRRAIPAVRPVAGVIMRPPLVPDSWQPRSWLEALAAEGRVRRAQALPVSEPALPAVVDAVLDRIDLTDVVLERVALGPIVDQIMAEIDLDAIVARVDIDAIAARLDIDAVIDRIDLATIAREVIDDVDLPQIIRDSTGAMTSEAVIGVRMQGIEADERVGRIIDKILLRRAERKTQLRMPAQDDDATAE
jgi:hypothetical protein